ncbi:HDOD domain-containing protein [Andreprevotia chitinilytica]|uniref:HDOD domain-containing protein n=1 Tax=Andreprevotia chitinilytica TaxID=396808 RepID=UPI000689E227|nr:HDOD domain-containing protein [Andreprevotia chitinilytica]
MATVSATPAEVTTWLRYWNARPWPAFKETREQLMPLLRRADRIKSDEVANVVLGDPLLCAQVLKLVNQRDKSSLAADVTTIESAIMLFGLTAFLERFSRGPAVEDLLQNHPQVLAAVYAEAACARVSAELAREFANQRIDAKLEEIYLSAYLAHVPQLLRQIASIDPNAPRVTGEALGLIGGWKLPDAFRKLNEFGGDMQPRIAMQHAVLELVPGLERGWWQQAVQQSLITIAAVLDRPAEDVWDTIRHRLLQIARAPRRQVQEHWPAARWLPMLPGEWPVPKVAAPVSAVHAVPTPTRVLATPAIAPPVPRAAPASPVVAPTTPVAPVPHPIPAPAEHKPPELLPTDPLAQAMQALHLAGKSGAPTNVVMQRAFKALINGLGMRRVMFCLLDAEKQTLKARFSHGAEDDDPLRIFMLALDPPHLLTKLMSKQQSIWLNNATRAELGPRLPPLFLRQCGKGDFCAMSIFVGNRPVGLIYADRPADRPIDNDVYAHFKQICLLVSRALADRAQ